MGSISHSYSPLTPDVSYFVTHLIRVFQPFRLLFQAQGSGIFHEDTEEKRIVAVQNWIDSSRTFAGRRPTEGCSVVWNRLMKELQPRCYLKWSAFRHWVICFSDLICTPLYSKSSLGKDHRDFLLHKSAAADAEGHTPTTKALHYGLIEVGDQVLKDYLSGKPDEMLMFATGTDRVRRGTEQVIPRPPPVAPRGRRNLVAIVMETPKTMYHARSQEIHAALLRHTDLTSLLSKKQGYALAVCWPDSEVMFRQVFLPTASGKTLVFVLPLLASKENRALVIISMSRAQIEGTAADIRALLSKRPDVEVLILRPSTIREIARDFDFEATNRLHHPVVLLVCLESLTDLDQFPDECACISRLIRNLARAGLVDQIVSEESHSFELSDSQTAGRPALLRFPSWLTSVLGDSLESIVVPHTRVTGTPGSRELQEGYWKSMLPSIFGAGDVFESCVATVQADPCRPNVVLDVLDWDQLVAADVEPEQQRLLMEKAHFSRRHAREAALLIERLVQLGVLHIGPTSTLSGNVLVCLPRVSSVRRLMTALEAINLPKLKICGDWAKRDDDPGSDGLQRFRDAENSICISTTRALESFNKPNIDEVIVCPFFYSQPMRKLCQVMGRTGRVASYRKEGSRANRG